MEFTHHANWLLPGLFFSPMCVCSVSQSYPTLWGPMDSSLLGSSTHGIFQARILEWIATSSSRGFSWPRDQNCTSHVSCTGEQKQKWSRSFGGVPLRWRLGEGFQWIFESLQRMSRKEGGRWWRVEPTAVESPSFSDTTKPHRTGRFDSVSWGG